MKILILTQKIDKDDPILGFFHEWVDRLSKNFSQVSVICLEKGKFDLPQKVRVFSLGKEVKYESRIMNYELCKKIKYILNFFRFSFFSSLNYDVVFVHMNQEYVLLGGIFWKILGKKIYFWRNHPNGNWLTQMAAWLSNKVFCTSKFAYVAKYKKTEIMPVGIDTNKFIKFESLKVYKVKNSILFLGRMSPIKKPDLLVEALNILNKKGIDFISSFYGDPLPKDQNYYDSLKNKVREFGLQNKVNFYKGVPNHEAPEVYNQHEIFVNLTPTGSFDKTILEAAACGCVLVLANQSLADEIDGRMMAKDGTPNDIAERINFWLNVGNEERKNASEKVQKYVLDSHSLDILIKKFILILNNNEN